MPTSRERVLEIALEVLRESPNGVRFAALTREIIARDSSLNPETVRYYVWGLAQSYPDRVCRPARGVIQLVEYDGPPAGPPMRPASPGTADHFSDMDGDNRRTFIFGRDGRPVAVLLPIEEYGGLLRGQAGGFQRDSRGAGGSTGGQGMATRRDPQRPQRPPGASDAKALADHIRSIEGFAFVEPDPPHAHMGATLVDSILQRGMNYDAVVLPRVRKLRDDHPEAATTSGFAGLMQQVELSSLIDFRGEYVLATIRELTEVLLDTRVETEEELRVWLDEAANRQRLAQIKGIGPKTGEFMRLRCGARDAVAVDRWLIRMLEEADVDVKGFWNQHKVISDAAGLLGVPAAELEESIWTYMSKRRESKAP